MENLRQVLYNFHRNGGGQPCISTTHIVSYSTNTVTNNISNNPSTSTNIQQQQHHPIQMPLLGNSTNSSSIIPGVAVTSSVSSNNSSATVSTNPITLNQPQHVGLIPNNPSSLVGSHSEVEQRIKAQVQQRLNPTNMSPMNIPLTNMEHSLDGVVGNGGDGAVAATIGAAGGEGPSCIAASAANKSSDDSSDCQG